MELEDPSTPDDDRPSIADAHEGRCATPPPSPERLPPSPEPISSPTHTVDTEIAPTIISLQLKRDDIAVFQAAPHLLAEAAVEECLLRSDGEYGGLELLIATIVRVRAPFRDPRFPMYCAARVAALRGSAIEVDLLDRPTILALGEERRTVTITDLSNQMLSAEERLAAGLPHVVDAATALATGQDLGLASQEVAILSAASTQLYADQLLELRKPCGCGEPSRDSHSPQRDQPNPVRDPRRGRRTKIERRWHELRGGVFEHELTERSPGGCCPPGHLSFHELIGDTLGGKHLDASRDFMRNMSIKRRCCPGTGPEAARVARAFDPPAPARTGGNWRSSSARSLRSSCHPRPMASRCSSLLSRS